MSHEGAQDKSSATISIDAEVLDAADALAHRMRINRSQLFERAAVRFIAGTVAENDIAAFPLIANLASGRQKVKI